MARLHAIGCCASGRQRGDTGTAWDDINHFAIFIIEGGDNKNVAEVAALVVANFARNFDPVFLTHRFADDGGAAIGDDANVVPAQRKLIAVDIGGGIEELQLERIGLGRHSLGQEGRGFACAHQIAAGIVEGGDDGHVENGL